jgi:hypothetical protein
MDGAALPGHVSVGAKRLGGQFVSQPVYCLACRPTRVLQIGRA